MAEKAQTEVTTEAMVEEVFTTVQKNTLKWNTAANGSEEYESTLKAFGAGAITAGTLAAVVVTILKAITWKRKKNVRVQRIEELKMKRQQVDRIIFEIAYLSHYTRNVSPKMIMQTIAENYPVSSLDPEGIELPNFGYCCSQVELLSFASDWFTFAL